MQLSLPIDRQIDPQDHNEERDGQIDMGCHKGQVLGKCQSKNSPITKALTGIRNARDEDRRDNNIIHRAFHGHSK